jgi:hypothetical protein
MNDVNLFDTPSNCVFVLTNTADVRDPELQARADDILTKSFNFPDKPYIGNAKIFVFTDGTITTRR